MEPSPIVQPLVTWLDATEFPSPRHKAVAATAWYDGDGSQWAGALHYAAGNARLTEAHPSSGLFGETFPWVIRGYLGPMHRFAGGSLGPVGGPMASSELSLGFGFRQAGSSSLYEAYAEAKALPSEFGPHALPRPIVLLNAFDSAHCIRGRIEVGDDLPNLWITLGPIYTFETLIVKPEPQSGSRLREPLEPAPRARPLEGAV